MHNFSVRKFLLIVANNLTICRTLEKGNTKNCRTVIEGKKK